MLLTQSVFITNYTYSLSLFLFFKNFDLNRKIRDTREVFEKEKTKRLDYLVFTCHWKPCRKKSSLLRPPFYRETTVCSGRDLVNNVRSLPIVTRKKQTFLSLLYSENESSQHDWASLTYDCQSLSLSLSSSSTCPVLCHRLLMFIFQISAHCIQKKAAVGWWHEPVELYIHFFILYICI